MEQDKSIAVSGSGIHGFLAGTVADYVIAIAGSVFGEEAARGEVLDKSRLSRQRWRGCH